MGDNFPVFCVFWCFVEESHVSRINLIDGKCCFKVCGSDVHLSFEKLESGRILHAVTVLNRVECCYRVE